MKRLQLYKELRHHRKLADERAIDFNKNKAAKVLVYIGVFFTIAYLIFFSIMFSLIANEERSLTALELAFGGAPFILVIDFLFRFIAQQTPAQLVKPYLLLPVSRYTCAEAFCLSSLFTWGNTIWFAMLLPYALMSVVFSYGIWASLLLLLTFYVLFLISSQWYLICRTLINSNIFWWMLPAAVYGIMALPWLIKGFKYFFEFYSKVGDLYEHGNPLPLLAAIVALCAIVFINRQVQFKHIMTELGKSKKATKLRTVSKFSFLDRYGEMGEYLKMEIKMVIRNRNTRSGFITAAIAAIIFSVLVSYTDIYGDEFSRNYWSLYNFMIFGSVVITRVMSYEGNYIECLLVHKQNILKLLMAKYIFNSITLIIPFLIMIPGAIKGNFTFLQLISYGIFTMGFTYWMLFQLAVYNRQTVPLNEKITGRNGQSANYVVMILSFVSFILPIATYFILKAFMPANYCYLVMLVVGLIFAATVKPWMSNIYRRMMKRKYKNLEGFRETR